MRIIGALTGLAMLGLAQGAAAADLAGSWFALSNTAVSITGDITVLADAITFQNGAKIHIAPDGTAKGTWAGQSAPVDGAIYRLDPPEDPVLLNGNQFCGLPGNKPTYVVLAPFDEGLSLIVYTGDAKPTPDADTCSIYNYSK